MGILQFFHHRNNNGHSSSTSTFGVAGLTTALGLYIYQQNLVVEAKEDGQKEEQAMSRREQRFNEFASFEYYGQIVMSPQDFIESITENKPKRKLLCQF